MMSEETTARSAMKLALEALEYIEHNYMSLPAPAEKAVTALREALTNEALDKKAENARELGLNYEPRRWAVFCQGCRKEWSVSYPHPGKSICADCDDKLAGQLAQQEPVATVTSESGNPNVSMSWWHEPALPVGTKLYTCSPAQRTWVGLTDEEVIDIAGSFDYRYDVARAAEAKLKEKNT